MRVPRLKPLFAAVILSLLIHGGLMAVISVKTYVHQLSQPPQLTVGATSSRVQFLSTGEEREVGRKPESDAVQMPAAPRQPSPVPQIEAPPSSLVVPPLGLAAANVETNQEEITMTDVSEVATTGDSEGGAEAVGGSNGSGGGNASISGKGAAYAHNPLPPYPKEARERRWEGTTLLLVEVRADGTVGKVEIAESTGYVILDESCVQTVRGWKFSPGRSGGAPVASLVEIPITFRLVE